MTITICFRDSICYFNFNIIAFFVFISGGNRAFYQSQLRSINTKGLSRLADKKKEGIDLFYAHKYPRHFNYRLLLDKLHDTRKQIDNKINHNFPQKEKSQWDFLALHIIDDK